MILSYFCIVKSIKLILFTALVLFSSCQNEPTNTNIPIKRVSFLIDTSLSGPDYKLHDGMGVNGYRGYLVQ